MHGKASSRIGSKIQAGCAVHVRYTPCTLVLLAVLSLLPAPVAYVFAPLYFVWLLPRPYNSPRNLRRQDKGGGGMVVVAEVRS